MDMRCTARIGYRPDGAETVAPCPVGNGVAIALKIFIAQCGAALAGVTITPVGITLPDFNPRIRYRPAIEVLHATTEFRHPPRGDTVPAGYLRQVVVIVQRQL